MSAFASIKYDEILTHDDDPQEVLRTPTNFITEQNWHVVQATVDRLIQVRNKILKGGAGLAAPQIGIPQPIFIYSPDRSDTLIVVINPSFKPLSTEIIEGHEACFSVPLHCTKLPRWKKIQVKYQRLDGSPVEEVLEGFSAKVFQHEMDHLKGKLTIDHPAGEIDRFDNPQAFQEHMHRIHSEDAKTYQRKSSLSSSDL